jgi:hypothetical protein
MDYERGTVFAVAKFGAQFGKYPSLRHMRLGEIPIDQQARNIRCCKLCFGNDEFAIASVGHDVTGLAKVEVVGLLSEH